MFASTFSHERSNPPLLLANGLDRIFIWICFHGPPRVSNILNGLLASGFLRRDQITKRKKKWDRETHHNIETRLGHWTFSRMWISFVCGLLGVRFPFQIVPMADSHPRLVDPTLQTPDDGIENTTPPAPHPAAACTICLGPVEPSNDSEPPFHWPGCQHPLHLSCVANLRAHTPQPTCPACRHPWGPATETSLQTLCHQHGILIPDPASHLHVQHEDPQPPAPPPNILPLCCHRVILVDPNRAHADEAWRELPDRHMQWAPYFDQRQQQWTPEWTCPRCSTSITPGHHLLQEVPQQPHCPRHGPRTLVVDIPRGERGWACTTSTNPPHLRDCNPVALPPAPATMPATTTPTTRATAASRWHSQAPPAQASNPGPTNSWLYVPLLHAGVGRRTAQAEQAWLHHPNSTQT